MTQSEICLATHPEHGPCTRQGYPHERHAAAGGQAWYSPTNETLPERLRRLASELTPPTVDARVTSYYEGYGEAMADAAAIAEVQLGALPQVLAVLSGHLTDHAGYLLLQVKTEADMAKLLPDARRTNSLEGVGDNLDVVCRARTNVGQLLVTVSYSRPPTAEELVKWAEEQAERRKEAGFISQGLLIIIGVVAVLIGAGLLLHQFWGSVPIGAWVVMSIGAVMAAAGARRSAAPPPPLSRPEPAEAVHLVPPRLPGGGPDVGRPPPPPQPPPGLRRDAGRIAGDLLVVVALLALAALAGCGSDGMGRDWVDIVIILGLLGLLFMVERLCKVYDANTKTAFEKLESTKSNVSKLVSRTDPGRLKKALYAVMGWWLPGLLCLVGGVN